MQKSSSRTKFMTIFIQSSRADLNHRTILPPLPSSPPLVHHHAHESSSSGGSAQPCEGAYDPIPKTPLPLVSYTQAQAFTPGMTGKQSFTAEHFPMPLDSNIRQSAHLRPLSLGKHYIPSVIRTHAMASPHRPLLNHQGSGSIFLSFPGGEKSNL